jgi:hypothetical protein
VAIQIGGKALSAANSPARFLFVDKAAVRNIPDP